jgi:hypothetical protein
VRPHCAGRHALGVSATFCATNIFLISKPTRTSLAVSLVILLTCLYLKRPQETLISRCPLYWEDAHRHHFSRHETTFSFNENRGTMLVAVREYSSLFYWWTLFYLNSLFLRFIYTITPLETLKKKITEYSATVGIKVTCVNDEIAGKKKQKLDKNKYTVEVLVKDDRFFYKIFDATLGIGEAYMVRMKKMTHENTQQKMHPLAANTCPKYLIV